MTFQWYSCKKCEEFFHPSWLEIHKQSHENKGDWIGICGKPLTLMEKSKS